MTTNLLLPTLRYIRPTSRPEVAVELQTIESVEVSVGDGSLFFVSADDGWFDQCGCNVK
jgi:hypothetical protein